MLEIFPEKLAVVAPEETLARALVATECNRNAYRTVKMLDAVGHPFNQVLKVLLISRTDHIADVVAHEGPVAFFGLDAEAAPQIEHVIRDFERPAWLEYDAAPDVLAAIAPLKPSLANFDSARCGLAVLMLGFFMDDQIGEHLVKVLDLHDTDVTAHNDRDHNLVAILDDGVSLVHRSQ